MTSPAKAKYAVEIATSAKTGRRKTMKRNCDNCIYATRSGGCVAWNCEPIPIREAEKAWKEARERENDETDRP